MISVPNAVNLFVDFGSVMVTLLTDASDRVGHAGRMPCSNTSHFTKTLVRLTGQLLDVPTGDNTYDSQKREKKGEKGEKKRQGERGEKERRGRRGKNKRERKKGERKKERMKERKEKERKKERMKERKKEENERKKGE